MIFLRRILYVSTQHTEYCISCENNDIDCFIFISLFMASQCNLINKIAMFFQEFVWIFGALILASIRIFVCRTCSCAACESLLMDNVPLIIFNWDIVTLLLEPVIACLPFHDLHITIRNKHPQMRENYGIFRNFNTFPPFCEGFHGS